MPAAKQSIGLLAKSLQPVSRNKQEKQAAKGGGLSLDPSGGTEEKFGSTAVML